MKLFLCAFIFWAAIGHAEDWSSDIKVFKCQIEGETDVARLSDALAFADGRKDLDRAWKALFEEMLQQITVAIHSPETLAIRVSREWSSDPIIFRNQLSPTMPLEAWENALAFAEEQRIKNERQPACRNIALDWRGLAIEVSGRVNELRRARARVKPLEGFWSDIRS